MLSLREASGGFDEGVIIIAGMTAHTHAPSSQLTTRALGLADTDTQHLSISTIGDAPSTPLRSALHKAPADPRSSLVSASPLPLSPGRVPDRSLSSFERSAAPYLEISSLSPDTYPHASPLPGAQALAAAAEEHPALADGENNQLLHASAEAAAQASQISLARAWQAIREDDVCKGEKQESPQRSSRQDVAQVLAANTSSLALSYHTPVGLDPGLPHSTGTGTGAGRVSREGMSRAGGGREEVAADSVSRTLFHTPLQSCSHAATDRPSLLPSPDGAKGALHSQNLADLVSLRSGPSPGSPSPIHGSCPSPYVPPPRARRSFASPIPLLPDVSLELLGHQPCNDECSPPAAEVVTAERQELPVMAGVEGRRPSRDVASKRQTVELSAERAGESLQEYDPVVTKEEQYPGHSAEKSARALPARVDVPTAGGLPMPRALEGVQATPLRQQLSQQYPSEADGGLEQEGLAAAEGSNRVGSREPSPDRPDAGSFVCHRNSQFQDGVSICADESAGSGGAGKGATDAVKEPNSVGRNEESAAECQSRFGAQGVLPQPQEQAGSDREGGAEQEVAAVDQSSHREGSGSADAALERGVAVTSSSSRADAAAAENHRDDRMDAEDRSRSRSGGGDERNFLSEVLETTGGMFG